MSSSPNAVTSFVAAVRAGDRSTTAALVDWPVSGVARMVRALADAEPGDRARLARRGLTGLRSEGVSEPIPLSWLALCVGADVCAEPATADQVTAGRASLDAPDLPKEVDNETRTSLIAIASRARGVQEVYSLRCGDRTACLLATGATIAGVAVVRRIDRYSSDPASRD